MFLTNFVNNLAHSIKRYPATVDYLNSRGVTNEEIVEHQIGYSKILNIPADGSADRKRFMEETWRGKKFENKIIFPLRDMYGKIVGMHGRDPNTKMFVNFITEEAKFSGFMFGFFESLPHIYQTGRVYYCEGPFDYFALKKVFPNSVSGLTAELSKDQYSLLRFFCDRIVTVFDSDVPGRKATERASKKEGVYSMDLGYKDPSNCLEVLTLSKFKTYAQRRANDIPPF